jgi:hypothetical protein
MFIVSVHINSVSTDNILILISTELACAMQMAVASSYQTTSHHIPVIVTFITPPVRTSLGTTFLVT